MPRLLQVFACIDWQISWADLSNELLNGRYSGLSSANTLLETTSETSELVPNLVRITLNHYTRKDGMNGRSTKGHQESGFSQMRKYRTY